MLEDTSLVLPKLKEAFTGNKGDVLQAVSDQVSGLNLGVWEGCMILFRILLQFAKNYF